MTDFALSFLGGGLGVAIVGFLGREWFSARLKASIEKEQKIGFAAFEIKRAACLEALQIGDAFMSQLEWKHDGGDLDVERQSLSIEKARDCYNKLALSCDSSKTLEAYIRLLCLRSPGDAPLQIDGSTINELRNAMRSELGFGTRIELPKEKAWIATLSNV